jgi:hypothetical protein
VLGLDCTITTGNFLPTLGAATPDQLSAWAVEHGWDSFANREIQAEADCKRIEAITDMSGMHQGAGIDYQDCLLS